MHLLGRPVTINLRKKVFCADALRHMELYHMLFYVCFWKS